MLSVEFYFHKQNGRCDYCQFAMTLGKSGGNRRATRDHVIPRSKTDGYIAKNIVAACQFCNTHKGSMSRAEFLAVLPALLEKRQMNRMQQKILRRPKDASFDGRPIQRKDALRSAAADLSYAAKSTAWAEPLAALLNLERVVAEPSDDHLARAAFAAWMNMPPDSFQVDEEWERIRALDQRYGGTSCAAWARVAAAVVSARALIAPKDTP